MRDGLTKPSGFRFLGLDLDTVIKYFFGGNALVAIVVLALITVFLFKEGFGFVAQNRRNLQVYRQAGLEYVDIMRARIDAHTELSRKLSATRLGLFKDLQKQGKSIGEISTSLAPLDEFSAGSSNQSDELRGLVSDYGDIAAGIKQQASEIQDRLEEKEMLRASGRTTEAEKVVVPLDDFANARKVILDTAPQYAEICRTMRTGMLALVDSRQPGYEMLPLDFRNEFRRDTLEFLHFVDQGQSALATWNPDKPVGYLDGLISFLRHPQWLTASFWQDWYGVIPLFVGSLFVSFVALLFAVPLGVSAAIYVNQIAGHKEASFVKPAIEFIAAFPSVVLGFFGVAILGETLRALSGWEFLSWISFFPVAERLNATTAGILLGFMAVPTIFSLAEDAINNVPVHFREASFALGASNLQTLLKITIPAALSGIIAAVLLGFGRVIGETMVVLLCAGNRIKIPDFTQGLGAFFQPVHTMTGIIAQEMGEVPSGSIHYRALFMVAILLFLLALGINLLAQKVVRRFRISIG